MALELPLYGARGSTTSASMRSASTKIPDFISQDMVLMLYIRQENEALNRRQTAFFHNSLQ